MLRSFFSRFRDYIIMAVLGVLVVYTTINSFVQKGQIRQLEKQQAQQEADIARERRQAVDAWKAQLDSSNKRLLRFIVSLDSTQTRTFQQYLSSPTLSSNVKSWQQQYRQFHSQ